MKKGIDFIGVGVGAMVFNDQGLVFMAKRGKNVRNEAGRWEFPGGAVSFGETLEEAIKREFKEECGVEICIKEMLCVTDHILPEVGQHWVSPTFIASLVSGVPTIKEPEKCSEIGWFSLDNLPSPLMTVSENSVKKYMERFEKI
ncbi:DNA mismatch repair protein MutT [Candidatus Peregrinibacteria bacterium]|nr:MAG: DNA mismatch repair protein MutT [Candidatus Peregrinibacteria bacterium]